MSTFRRRVPIVPKIVGRSPADYAQELQEYLKALLDSGEGRPAGFEDVDPTTIQAGTTADPGDPADGWMAASAVIPVETATPTNATGSAASEGSGSALMRADATVKQGIVTTKGDLLSYSTLPVRVAVGTDGFVLTADAASTPGVKWAAAVASFPLLAPDGSSGAPSYSFSNAPTSGIYITTSSSGTIYLKGKDASGTDAIGGYTRIDGGVGTGQGQGGDLSLTIAPPTSASGSSANSLQTGLRLQGSNGGFLLGNINISFGSPGSGTVRAANAATGVSNTAGGALNIDGGTGTGTGAGGNLSLRVTVPGSSGSTQNSYQNAAVFNGTNGTVTIGGVSVSNPTSLSSFKGTTATGSGNTGGAVTVAGGAATSGNAAGGDLTLDGGAPSGSGNQGRVKVPSTTWLQQAASRKVLGSDYTNATATFSNTALSISVVSGRKYTFQIVLFCADSTAADGIQLDFNGGSAGVTNFVAAGSISDATAGGNQEVTTLAGVISAATITGATKVVIDGCFEPSSTGTFILRAAQNAHTTGTLTIKRGSYIWVEDTA